MELKPCVTIEPGSDLRVPMGGVVIEDDVDDLVGRDLSVDHVQKLDELLMPVALHIASDNRPVEIVQGGKERRGFAALVVVDSLRLSSRVMVPRRPFFTGRPSWMRLKTWIWLFSSTDRTRT